MEEDTLETNQEKYTSFDTLQEGIGYESAAFSTQKVRDLPVGGGDTITGQSEEIGPGTLLEASQYTEESQALQYPLVEEELPYEESLLKNVLKGQDILWSKSCEDDDPLTKSIFHSPGSSPQAEFAERHLSVQPDIYGHTSSVLERSGSGQQSYGPLLGFAHLKQKRGPGRPRKDPFSTVLKRPRGRGTGRRGRPPLFADYRQSWQGLGSRQGSMDTVPSDPTDTEDGGLATHMLGSADSSSLQGCSADPTIAIPSTSDDTEPQSIGHTCALCNCGEKSLLGQGEIYRFEPTLGFNPFKRVLKSRRGSSESEEQSREKSPKHLTWRRARGPFKGSRERSRSPRQHSLGEDEVSGLLGTDELSLVGFTDDVEVSAVFDLNGCVWAHSCCAVWSEGVAQVDGRLQFVDRAVFSGLSQKCGYCRRYGASLACRSPRCSKKYHFPCASAGGCFQDLKTLSLLCPDHTSQAEVIAGNDAFCIQCGYLGNVSETLFCTSCGQHYHGNCLCPPVEVKPIVRAGWQCPNCKICQTCRQPGDDIKMLVCDTCDKGYHTFCLKPAMTTIPKNGWKCKNCRVCSDCGARTPGNGPSSRWHLNYSVCDSCYQQRNKGLCCPLCGKAYRHFQHNNKTMMVPCSSCKKHVHSECDPAIDSTLLQAVRDGAAVNYVCQVCRESDSAMGIEPFGMPGPSGTDESLESFPLTKADSEISLRDNPVLAEASLTAASSQESLYFEDSNSSLDYDTDKSRSLVPEKRRHHPLSLSEKRRGPKIKIKTSPVPPAPSVSAPTTPVPTTQLAPLTPTRTENAAPVTSPPSSTEKKEKAEEEDDGDDHPSTIILAESKDKFVMDQDVCKSCGSFGKGEESRLIVCTQCGQCYHPYCVSVKVTKVILKKGWRCLDCTVCEGCGGPDDEGRLLLCDDCDISYHTYCLDPPLQHVPKGTWKCKWCVRCLYCGTTTPGVGCQWMSNYTKCGPCHSKLSCPVCCRHYREDELIIQCVQCDRWLHCGCDGLKNEDEAEVAADYGYHCLYCRPRTGKTGPLPPPPPPPPMEEDLKPPTPPLPPMLMEPLPPPEGPRQYLIDGVYLLANGMQQIQSQVVQLPKKTRQPRKFRTPGGLMSRHPQVSRLYSMPSQDGEDSFDKDEDLRLFGGLEPGELPTPASSVPDLTPEEEAELAKKKRQRRIMGLGVGGFMLRGMGRKMMMRRQASVDEHPEDDVATADGDAAALPPKKPKGRRKSKKSKLEESFPSYLQEAFFGRDLMDSSKFMALSSQDMLHSGSDSDTAHPSRASSPTPSLPSTSTAVPPAAEVGPDGDAKPIAGNGDLDKIAGGIQRNLTPVASSQHSSDVPDLDEGDMDILPSDVEEDLFSILDSELKSDLSKDKAEELADKGGDVHKDALPENLAQILGSNQNIDVEQMLSEGLFDKDTVEDILKGVMKGDEDAHTQAQGPEHLQLPPGMPGPSHANMPPQAGGMQGMPVGPGPGHMMRSGPGMGPDGQPPSPLPPYSMVQFDPMGSQMGPGMGPGMAGPSPVCPPWVQGPSDEDDGLGGSNKRSILKWETDEALGPNATISAVLYVNLNFPNLKEEYPEWSERSKQIAKLWRKLKPEEKAPFLAKARKNRTSHRVQKAQKQVSQELKRRQEAQMLQDSEAMPPPPAPPPLPGVHAGGDPFSQPPGPHDPPEALSPSMRSPLHSPGGPGGSPFHRNWEDPFHKPPSMDPTAEAFSQTGSHGRQGAGAQTHDSFAFPSPGGTPKHDPFAMSPGTPRPRPPHPGQSFDQFGRGQPAPSPSHQSSVDDPYVKQPMTPRIYGPSLASAGGHGRNKPDELGAAAHDPYAFPPTTPRSTTPQDEAFHPPLRPPHSAPDSFPGTPQPGMVSRQASDPGADIFHIMPQGAGMQDSYGQPMASSSAHASPVHSVASTPPRPVQFGPSPGGSGMTSPLRHPDNSSFLPEPGFKSPTQLQRSNSMPHSYGHQGGPPRMPMDPALSRSMSDVTPEALQHMHPQMMLPRDPAMASRRLKLVPPQGPGPGPRPWSYPVVHPSVTKMRLQRKDAERKMTMGPPAGHPLHHQWLQQQQEGMGGAPAPGMPPTSMMQRMPGPQGFREGSSPGHPGMVPDRWPMEPRMVRPPNPAQFPPDGREAFSPRGQFGEGGQLRFPGQRMPRPPGAPGMPQMMTQGMQRPHLEGYPQGPQQEGAMAADQRAQLIHMMQEQIGQAGTSPHMSPSHMSPHQHGVRPHHMGAGPGGMPQEMMSLRPRLEQQMAGHPGATQTSHSMLPELHRPSDDEVFQHLRAQQGSLMAGTGTKPGEGGTTEGGSAVEGGIAVEGEPIPFPSDKDLKPSISSEDDKPEDDDLLLEDDGTFDILKYADPELDLDDSNIMDTLDLMDDPKASSGENEDKKDDGDDKPAKKAEDRSVEEGVKVEGPLDADMTGEDGTTRPKDFQAQFLEFSQRRAQQLDTDGTPATHASDKDKSEEKAGVSHIAALLQGTKPISTRQPPGDAGKMAGPDASALTGAIQSVLQRSPFASQLAQQSPPGQGGALPGPSGLPSPKVSQSPRSGQPSPRTPGIQSPYSQIIGGRHSVSPHSQPLTPAGQLSPFSQQGSGQSPFSPTMSSAQSPFTVAGGTPASTPQSPYPMQGPSRTISPFTMPVSGSPVGTSQTGPLQHHPSMPGQPQQTQQQLASRGTITPTNQYNQGTYGQPQGALGPPPRGGTLTPTPNSILYGQSATTQHTLRPQGPRPFVPGQELGGEGVEVAGMAGMQPGMMQQQPRFPGAVPGMRPPPTSTHPSLQQHLTQGQPRPPFSLTPGQHRMMTPGLHAPGSAAARRAALTGSQKEQHTLLDELLEQEKEEQKRQAEQQAMLHRREGQPDVMMPGGPRLPGMMSQQMQGMQPHGMGPRMGGPEGWPAPPSGQGSPGDLPPGQQFPPGFGPRMPGQQMGPHGPLPPFPSTSQAQPLPGQGMIPPPPQPPVPSAELASGPEYDRQVLQYEDWLSKQSQYLEMQVKALEQQIQKQKRAKKTIQARQRQARKNNQEMNPKDALELERVAAEQSELQKQLESQRKQSRQHQVVVQEYYNKQKEQLGPNWGMMGLPRPPGPPATQLPPGAPASTAPLGTSSGAPQMLQPRIPGSPSSIRMSPTARQEYDAYMQSRLRMAAQSPGARARAPTTIHLGDNNPFSETFQVREQIMKMQQTSGPMPPVSPSDTPTPSPGVPSPAATGPARPPGEGMAPIHFFRERTLDAGPRFRSPGPFGEAGPRGPVEGPRLPSYPSPSLPGFGMGGERIPFSQSIPLQPGFGHAGMPVPPSAGGDMGAVPPPEGPKPKAKKRRKKKKVDDADGTQSQPLPPSMPSQSMMGSGHGDGRGNVGPGLPKPPEFPKPQSETDRRILEILSNTAALAGKESQIPPTKGNSGKTARSKSPAAATVPPPPPAKPAPEMPGEGDQPGGALLLEGTAPFPGAMMQQMPGQNVPSSVSGPASHPSDGGKSVASGTTAMPQPLVSSSGVQTATSHPPSSGMTTEAGTITIPPGQMFPHPQHPNQLPPRPGFPPQGLAHRMMTPHGGLPPQGVPQGMPTSMGMQMRHAGQPMMGTFPPGHPMARAPHGHPFHPGAMMPGMQQLGEHPRLLPHMMQMPGTTAAGMSPRLPQPGHPPPPPPSVQDPAAKTSEASSVSAPPPVSEKLSGDATAALGTQQPSGSSPPSSEAPPTTSEAQPAASIAASTSTPTVQESTAAVTVPAVTTSSTAIASTQSADAAPQSAGTSGTTDSTPPIDADKEGEKTQVPKKTCDDGIHCGTDDEADSKPVKKVCDDGIHCGTDDEEDSKPAKKLCDDGVHCGTDDEADSKPAKKVCDDGIHCGTDDEDDTKSKQAKKICGDGIHCGTDDEEDPKPVKKVCDDGIHCGTDDEDDAKSTPVKKVCDDGIHCGTDNEDDSKARPAKKVCDDGIHCGTDDEEDPKPAKKVCDDGIHCGTDDEDDAKSKPVNKVCDDGIHCGTDDEDDATSKPAKKVCDDGIHCGTDDEEDKTKDSGPPAGPAGEPAVSSQSVAGSSTLSAVVTSTPSTSSDTHAQPEPMDTSPSDFVPASTPVSAPLVTGELKPSPPAQESTATSQPSSGDAAGIERTTLPPSSSVASVTDSQPTAATSPSVTAEMDTTQTAPPSHDGETAQQVPAIGQMQPMSASPPTQTRTGSVPAVPVETPVGQAGQTSDSQTQAAMLSPSLSQPQTAGEQVSKEQAAVSVQIPTPTPSSDPIPERQPVSQAATTVASAPVSVASEVVQASETAALSAPPATGSVQVTAAQDTATNTVQSDPQTPTSLPVPMETSPSSVPASSIAGIAHPVLSSAPSTTGTAPDHADVQSTAPVQQPAPATAPLAESGQTFAPQEPISSETVSAASDRPPATVVGTIPSDIAIPTSTSAPSQQAEQGAPQTAVTTATLESATDKQSPPGQVSTAASIPTSSVEGGVSTAPQATTTTTSVPHSRPQLPPLSIGGPSHYPPGHPLAGQQRPPLDMLAHVSQSALSSAGTALPTSQPSPTSMGGPSPGDMARGGFPRHMTPPMGPHPGMNQPHHPGMSSAPGPTSQHSPTMAFPGEGGYMPHHPMFPGPGMGPRYRGMGPGEYPQSRGMMSPPAMSPTSPSQRGQRPQFPPFHGPEMMHPAMGPRQMGPHGPRPMMPPEMIGGTSSPTDTHMMSPLMSGMGSYPHPPHTQHQAMMNRPPFPMPLPHSTAGMDFQPRPHHSGMSMAGPGIVGYHGHRMPGPGHQSAPHSPSATSPLHLQSPGPGFPKDPRMMSPESHMMGDARMAANLRMMAEQRMGMPQRHIRPPMSVPGGGTSGFPPHQRPRHPMYPEDGSMDQFHPMHGHPRPPGPPSLPDSPQMAGPLGGMSPMGRPSFPEAVSLASTSSMPPILTSAAPGAVSSAGMDMSSGMKGLGISVNLPGIPSAMMVKSEPREDFPFMGGTDGRSREEIEHEQRAKHNALLKQLLSNQQALQADSHPPSTPDSEDSLPQLTPEQQRQLELIDMMPLCKEKEAESSNDIMDWDSKTVEEREQIIELRKQEYEKKRKQYEAVRKIKRKTQGVGTSLDGAGQQKAKKRRNKSIPSATTDSATLAATDLSAEAPVAVKRRRRKNKSVEQREMELEFMAETFLQQLHNLPSVALREPTITLTYSLVPIKGATTVTGESALRGTYGQGYLEGTPDHYGSLCFPPPPSTLRPTTSATAMHRTFVGQKEHKHVAEGQPFSMRTAGLPPCGPSPTVHHPPEPGMPPFALPAHPRIEVKSEPLRDTPDTIISSSSPEVGFAEKDPEYPSLRLIDPASPGAVDDQYSPTVPLLYPIPIRPKPLVEKAESMDTKPVIPTSQPLEQEHFHPGAELSQKKEPADVAVPPEVPSKDLTVKLPSVTSGLAHPFIDPTLDQKVSVTLTLSASAAEDIGGVISAIADLLKIAVPPTYEITRTPSPEMFKLNLTHKEEAINVQALMRTKHRFCGHCRVVLISSGICKPKSELPPVLLSDDLDPGEEEVTFCSINCMNQFLQTAHILEENGDDNSNTSNSTSTIIMDELEDSKDMEDSVSTKIEPQASSTGVEPPSPKVGVAITEALSISTSSPALSASASATTQPGTPTTPTAGPSSWPSPAESHSMTSPMLRAGTLGSASPVLSPQHSMLSPPLRSKEERIGKRHRRSSSTASQEGYIYKPQVKRWHDVRWKRWDTSITLTKLPDTSTKELHELWESLGMVLRPSTLPEDTRACTFCHLIGDGDPDGPSRLLNMDVNKWVHLNCALWSYDVYETCNGALMNVEVAYRRGMITECISCRKMGATLACFKARCTNSYHLPCAREKGCMFFQDKTFLCVTHIPKQYVENELLSLEVPRRVYINRDEDRQVASMVCSMIHQDEGHHSLRIGSLILHSIGQLLPHQIQTNRFNTRDYIFPVGFRTSRFYWSHRFIYHRCRYICSIRENEGAPEFSIRIVEEGHKDITFKDKSPKDVWMHVFRPLEEMRSKADMVKMFPEFMCMEELFGLTEPAIIKVLESLPGTDLLQHYNFKFGRSPLIEMPPAINPTGCARTEPKLRTHFRRRPHTLHSSNSRSLPSTVTSVTGDINSPYMKQFVHSKSQQYRRLKTEWKNLVYLGRSHIQGLGLYAARDLEKHTMVIEYIGDLIRNEVANRREMEYENQNRGVYMFRIDNDTVIDATMAGGPARYINHSCSPNCAAEVVHFEKESKIIIITSRRISKGEELVYDYKFDFEDDQHKIPCLCGAPNCRKWMN